MGKEWINVREIGQLYLEKVLVTFTVPILFVCVDYEGSKYLCLNVDDETGKSIIAATDNKTLLEMLKNRVPMEQVFRNPVGSKLIVAEYDSEREMIISDAKEAACVSADLLPNEGEYFELDNKDIEEYVLHLEKQLVSVNLERFSDKKKYVISKPSTTANVDDYDVVNSDYIMMTLGRTKEISVYQVIDRDKMIA